MNKESYFLGIAAMLVLLLALLTGTALAADEEIAGADFNDGKMHWSISANHVLTISGTGEMPNYTRDVNAPWYPYQGQIESIIVEDSITALGNYAFYNCSKAVSIDIPDGITTIPESCFRYCSSLESIDLPDSVRTFGDSAFCNCSQLKSITIPEGVTELTAHDLFYYCTSLKSITLPNTLIQIGAYYSDTFCYNNISNIYFNGTLKQWLNISFGNSLPMQSACSLYIDGEKLTNLTIPNGITNIPEYAFEYVNLNRVTIPNSVTSIGENAFYGSSVTTVRIADSVTSVETNAFANCSNLKKVYYVGDSSKWNSIAWNSGNDSLIDAKRQFVASFDDIRTVSLGSVEHGTLTLSDDNCILGDEITVTAKADPGYRLKTILVNGQAISGNSFVAEEGVDYVVSAEFEFYRGVKAHGTCGNNIVWYLYDNNELSIQGTGEMDGNPWTEYDDSIESVVIGQGVTTIDDNAFRNCSNLKTLTLPDSIAEIGHYTLSGCNVDSLYYNGDVKGWLSVYFRSNFLSPVKELYINDDLISDLHIPDGISKIPDYAFEGYSALQSVHFSAEVNYIGDYAFDCTSNLKYVEFTGNAPHTFARPFGNTDSTLVYYHQGTTGWTSPKWNGYYASCLEIDNYNTLDENNCNAQGILFTLNPTAKTATVGDGSSAINNSGYYGAQMGAVVIPDTVIKDGVSYQVIGIGKNAFYRNNHVTSVTIGANFRYSLGFCWLYKPEGNYSR